MWRTASAVAPVVALLLLAVAVPPSAEECRRRAAGQFAMADMASDPAFRSCTLPFASRACCAALAGVFGSGRPLAGCTCNEALFDDMRSVVASAASRSSRVCSGDLQRAPPAPLFGRIPGGGVPSLVSSSRR